VVSELSWRLCAGSRSARAPSAWAASSPTFVQVTSAHNLSVSSLTLTPPSAVTAGNRLVVEVGVWSAGNASAASVTDAAGNTYTELLHFKASENTEMSVWSAPITAAAARARRSP
jgi:hypothetical protein